LLGERVTNSEVSPREQLLEIHLIICVVSHVSRVDGRTMPLLDAGRIVCGMTQSSNMAA
jgi:hypothetical protein